MAMQRHKALLVGLVALTGAFSVPHSVLAAPPALLNFQGFLTDSARNPITDPALAVTFAIYDAEAAGTMLWAETQTVAVDRGIFSVQLGAGTPDPSSLHPLGPALFDLDPLWLQLSVGTDVLSRQRFTSVGYALKAADSDSLSGRTAAELDQAAHLADTANPHQVTAAQTGAVTSADVTGQVSAHAADASAHHAKTTSFAELSDEIGDTQIPATIARDAELSTSLGVHTGQPSAHHAKTSTFTELTGQIADAQIPAAITRDTELTWSNLSGIPSGFADGIDNGISSESDPQVGSNVTGYVPRWNGSDLASGSIYDNGNVGIGNTNPAQKLHVSSGNDGGVRIGNNAIWYGEIRYEYLPGDLIIENGNASAASGADILFRTDGAQRAVITGLGRLGVGTASPSVQLSVGGTGSTYGLSIGDDQTENALIYHSASALRIAAPGSRVQFGSAEYIEDCGANCTNLGSANVGIGTVTPTQKLHVAGRYLLVDGSGAEQAYLGGDGAGADVQLGSLNASIQNVALWNATSATRMNLYVGQLHIMGGSDLAEPFEVDRRAAILPGSVLAIDPANPGKLRLADEAYDRKVAGVVSGANGVRPGVTMSQEGTVADGEIPLALSGRVYCLADATQGAIEPGDLLTTSETPGYAMKVKDYDRALGASIGKAMTPLRDGKGMVLVLVSLH